MITATETGAYFRLLGSLLYNEPGNEVINMLCKDNPFSELPYAQNNELALLGQVQMNGWLEKGELASLTDEAREDYMRLLVGMGKVLAPPWGSVWLDKDRMLFTGDTLKVRLFYERHGMKVKLKYKEPDDHIGLEMEFLAYLLDRNDADNAVVFARQYMLPWVFEWNGAVQKYSETGYYRGIANMAAGGIKELCD